MCSTIGFLMLWGPVLNLVALCFLGNLSFLFTNSPLGPLFACLKVCLALVSYDRLFTSLQIWLHTSLVLWPSLNQFDCYSLSPRGLKVVNFARMEGAHIFCLSPRMADNKSYIDSGDFPKTYNSNSSTVRLLVEGIPYYWNLDHPLRVFLGIL